MADAARDPGPHAMAERLLAEHDGDAAYAVAIERLGQAGERGDRRDISFWRGVVASIVEIIAERRRRHDGAGHGKHDGKAP